MSISTKNIINNDDVPNLKSYPSLEQWLSLPKSDLAQYVRPKNVSVMLSIDGTRRHFLLNHQDSTKNLASTEEDASTQSLATAKKFETYVNAIATPLVHCFELLYSLGVKTVLTLPLLPSNFHRPSDYLQLMLEQSHRVFTGRLFSELYEKYSVQARLFGDYEFSPNALSVRPQLAALAKSLEVLTPSPSPFPDKAQEKGLIGQTHTEGEGQNFLLLGYYAGSFVEEILARSQQLLTASNFKSSNVGPDEDKIRAACFPYGPSKLDILVCAGWLKVGGMIHPVLDGGHTDIYNLSYLTLDLQEDSIRRILYDHLFLRNQWSDNDLDYTQEDLAELKVYYAGHTGGLIGLGRTVGPGVWYAEHPALS